MTLTLTLIRHAKSSWAEKGMDDFDRPLNARGLGDAPDMGRRLKAAGWCPDVIVASPAARAAATAKAIAKAIGYAEADIVWSKKLYLAAPKTMLAEAAYHGKGRTHVALVAHNPGTTELAEALTDVELGNVPTAGVVQIQLDAEDWDAVAGGTGNLIDFDYPKRTPA